jgi:hypothetical protein
MISLLKHLLWTCSGATVSLLKREECETEHSKYAAIGAAVFLTAVLAGVTASYAFSTIFDSVWWAVGLGCFWALMVFNLDRYIVLSIKKKAPNAAATLSERAKGWATELALALPRVALAALLAVAIAKPLELLIFHDEIELEKYGLRLDMAKEFQRELEPKEGGDTLAAQIKRLEDENLALEADIAAKEGERKKAKQNAVDEALGKKGDGLTGQTGPGRVFKHKDDLAKAVEAEADAYVKPRQLKMEANAGKIVELRGYENKAAADARDKAEKSDGLATRLRAFSRLAGRNDTVRYTNWVLMAIIMILELAPILTKLFAQYGPYDRLVEFTEQKFYLDKDVELEELRAQAERERRASLSRDGVISDLRTRLVSEVKADVENLKPNSEAQKNWHTAKNALIEQAAFGLSYSNGDRDGG